MTTKLTYTKAIKNGKLKATDMGVGESVTGVLLGFKTNQYGTANPIIEVQGREVEIFAAGNLKFLEGDVAKGQKQIGEFTVITRQESVDIKGRTTSRFSVTQGQTGATAPQTAAATNSSVKDKLQAIRANAGNNNQ